MVIPLDAVRCLAADLLAPGRFFAAPALRLELTHQASEEILWEVFQGRLLEPGQSRQKQTFESWNLHVCSPEGRSPEPILALKLDATAGRLHVVRAVESHVWEGYDSGGGVYLSRQTQRWVRELIATFPLADGGDAARLREEVAHALGRAITGTRLPLIPIEAPLPLFSFGQLFALDVPDGSRDRPGDLRELAAFLPSLAEPARALEAWLRAVPLAELPAAAGVLLERWSGPELLRALRCVFADISLSPWTDFADKVLVLLEVAERQGQVTPAQVVDFESWLLCLLVRHLTAYDLVLFHHRGANYPDALLLDRVLGDLLEWLERQPELFAGPQGQPRRRAVRQAWVERRRYEGHLVPDVPTSPGEHLRVLPADQPRVPEEQILQPQRRRKRLYADAPLLGRLTAQVRTVLLDSVADGDHPLEQEELGTAVFLDRPLGGAKAPVEPDGTPFLASRAYSQALAQQRLERLASDLGLGECPKAPSLPGVPLARIGPPVRLGTVSLADAARSAPDFLFRRTLPGSLRSLWTLFDVPADQVAGVVLLARSKDGPCLIGYGADYEPRLVVEPCLEAGYRSRLGVEVPVAGLRLRPATG